MNASLKRSCRRARRAEVKASALQSIDFRAIFRDFQNLNPKDVGAWPTGAARQTLLSGLCLVIVVGLAGGSGVG
jgi:hypothetical protein